MSSGTDSSPGASTPDAYNSAQDSQQANMQNNFGPVTTDDTLNNIPSSGQQKWTPQQMAALQAMAKDLSSAGGTSHSQALAAMLASNQSVPGPGYQNIQAGQFVNPNAR
jgi:hypothetical protein